MSQLKPSRDKPLIVREIAAVQVWAFGGNLNIDKLGWRMDIAADLNSCFCNLC